MSDEVSRSSCWSLVTGGVAGCCTSCGWVAGVLGGAGTVVVSTFRSDGGVAGFFFGHPYRKVRRVAITIHIIHFRFMISPRSKLGSVQLAKRRVSTLSNPYLSGTLRDQSARSL